MTPSIITRIRDKQKQQKSQKPVAPPPHRPEMLYIGCIDARLDPIDDIGIPKGKSLIYRNIAALVRPALAADNGGGLENCPVASGEIPESVSIGAALEFFIQYIPAADTKHIVVAGHTDCGGIRACLTDAAKDDNYLPRYLSALKEAREAVLADNTLATPEAQARALEEACVRESLDNLMSYEVVRAAVAEGRVELHGWVIDTATQQIAEMDKNGQFQPLSS